MVDTPGRFFRVAAEDRKQGFKDSESEDEAPSRSHSRESNGSRGYAAPRRVHSARSLVSQGSLRSLATLHSTESDALNRKCISKPEIKIVDTAGVFFRRAAPAATTSATQNTSGSKEGTPRTGASTPPTSSRKASRSEDLTTVIEVLDLDGFLSRLGHLSAAERNIVHLKGFSSGMGTFYNPDVLSLLRDHSIIAFDGDAYDPTGYTGIVPQFLAGDSKRTAVAFRKKGAESSFLSKWKDVALKYPGRLQVVTVDLKRDVERFGLGNELATYAPGLPVWAQDMYLLGRVAIKATAAGKVVSLGGAGAGIGEARAGVAEGVSWTVFALSRGKQEEFQTMMDWAMTFQNSHNATKLVRLVRGKDPEEKFAFTIRGSHRRMSCFSWCQ
eukprot:TRINITY_DN122024_c0_g1_i1.p1 TRINITY_DN122024_c0_g1~~TRINITY_DN122024_c0_g1_i1.p1  ORF type:complete len:385 (-),score=62.74 TRINITY_DN122024_c0_g1_i1:154-1308(-)